MSLTLSGRRIGRLPRMVLLTVVLVFMIGLPASAAAGRPMATSAGAHNHHPDPVNHHHADPVNHHHSSPSLQRPAPS